MCSTWCFEPARESGLDSATNPKLSPPPQRGARRADCSARRCPPGARSHRENRHGHSLSAVVPGSTFTRSTVVVCVRCRGPAGQGLRGDPHLLDHDRRPAGLVATGWPSQGVTHVAMESTGVYWKPVFNILEGSCRGHLGQRRAHQAGAGAQDRRQGLPVDRPIVAARAAQGQFRAADAAIRELRDLTRQRTQLIQEKAAAANRIQKVLEDANIKLAGVATDVLGVSGRDMLRGADRRRDGPGEAGRLGPQAVAGEDSRSAAGVAGARDGPPPLPAADASWTTSTHLEELIGRLGGRIEEVMAPFAEAVAAAGRRSRGSASGRPRRSWRRSARTWSSSRRPVIWRRGRGCVRGITRAPASGAAAGRPRGTAGCERILVQAAWAASHTKGTYLAAQYRRLAKRRGKQAGVGGRRAIRCW